MSIIQVTNLHKSYETLKAVNGISFSIEKGEMFGLVGPDGAGKTTTIRILCGLIKQDEGVVLLMGKDILKEKKEIQNNIGYLSQKFSLYGDLTVDENIEFFAEIHDVKDYNQRRDELLEFTRLKPFRKRLADQLSGGMKQKLALACSLIHKPQILFLDEPTSGVDPLARRQFWRLIEDFARNGTAILVTTHYLEEAEHCNRMGFMVAGEVVTQGSPSQIKAEQPGQLLEVITDDTQVASNLLKTQLEPWRVSIFGEKLHVVVDHPEEISQLRSTLKEAKLQIYSLRPIPFSLEDAFIGIVQRASYSSE